ncbi:dGTP triphosphohydrolase [Vreelandella utahensis]|uniref:dGTP triphosphohydrolase n=1 Tax=Vreelandella halophila TaxID=86177 RepID=UPI002481ADC4|nr:dNTP triphosphohydrolase [Halomonas utahensis]
MQRFLRTRLTHSHEVSNLARSIGIRLAFEFPVQIFGEDHEKLNVKRTVPALMAAIGLAHDLGNPPFGHQGELAIRDWFVRNSKDTFRREDIKDFENFDGNAQTFRLVTRLQILNDDFGLNLTYAMLSALLKYPTFWSSIDESPYKKAGIFKSEEDIANDVWKETGLKQEARHPLTYLMEACDDIAYSVLDAEDTVKKGYASFYDLIDFLQHNGLGDRVTEDLIDSSLEKNREFKNENLSPRELNDISMQMFRVKAISSMINPIVEEFASNSSMIMANEYEGTLIESTIASNLCKQLKKFDFELGYKNKNVLELELRGANYIHSLMDMLWHAIESEGNETGDLFTVYAMESISENYKRIYKRELREGKHSKSYIQAQLLADTISGMTDSYLISLHDELRPLYDGSHHTCS